MIKKTVCFSLLLYDDFNGQCIRNGGHVFTLNGRVVTPIRKSDGYYVFVNPIESDAEIEVSGGAYDTQTVHLHAGELNPTFPVRVIRLMRRGHGGFDDCEFITGTYKPGEMIYALQQGNISSRLMSVQQEETDCKISFSGYFTQRVEHMRFLVGTGKNQEICLTGSLFPDKSYEIEAPFRHSHKAGEPIIRLYAAKCDENGDFAMAVEKGQQERISELLVCDKEEKKWGCLSVTALK